MQITIYGDVPVGAGLSSSASIAVATAVFLDILLKRHNDNLLLLPYDNSGVLLLNNDIKKIVPSSISSMLLPIPNTKKRAMLCQSSEVEFCNSPCGIMHVVVNETQPITTETIIIHFCIIVISIIIIIIIICRKGWWW